MNLDIQLFNLLTEYTLPEINASLGRAITKHVEITSVGKFAKKHGVQYRTIENKVTEHRTWKHIDKTPKDVKENVWKMWLNEGVPVSKVAKHFSVDYQVALKIVSLGRTGQLKVKGEPWLMIQTGW